MAMAEGSTAVQHPDEAEAPSDGNGDGRVPTKPDHTGGQGRDADYSITPLAWLAAGSGVVALALLTTQLALRLPSGYGIEDLLGWSRGDSVSAAVNLWCQFALRWRSAAAYVLVDSALFVPLYAVLFLATARCLHHALQPGPGLVAKITSRALPWLSVGSVAALVLVDLVENFAGALRLGVSLWAAGASLLIGIALLAVLWRWASAPAAQRDRMLCRSLGAVLLGGVVVLALIGLADARTACSLAAQAALPAPMSWAHHLKPVMIGLAMLPIAIGSLVWWFGLDLDLAQGLQRDEAIARAAWRAGVAGVVGRSRYVLVVLAMFGLFTLVLDQCRDVLLGLAYPDPAASPGALWWRRVVQVLCAVSVGMLAYSCWMWTRLAGMVKRPGLALGGGALVPDRVGAFARGWARAVSLIPLVMVAGLVAYTVGDAITAGLRAATPGTVAGQLSGTLLGLLGFGAVALGFGLFLLQLRRRLALAEPADYYNSEPDFYKLLWGDSDVLKRRNALRDLSGPPANPAPCIQRSQRIWGWIKPLGQLLSHWLWPLVHPVIWPLIALLLMAALRIVMAWRPDVTAQAPATIALLALALNWWLGVAGLLTLAEQRRAVAWSLLLLVLVALFAGLGWVDNHRLPLTAPRGADLATLRWHGVNAMLVLVLMGSAQWLLFCYRHEGPNRLFPRWSAPRFNLVRGFVAVALAVFATLALKSVDQASAPLVARADTRVPGPRQPPGQVLGSWVLELPANPPPEQAEVLLIAAEGGGIRSAYWTAQVLARLHDADPAIDKRIAALSGVSGGAVGIAVYRACLAHTRNGGSVRACVETGFRQLDGLSPLLGSLLFEDAFARVLPTTMKMGPLNLACSQPGCVHLSRAQPFEREWIRQFDHLGDSLGDLPSSEGNPPTVPPMLLNSTWVESGNRAVLGTLDGLDMPASHDLVAELGAWPPLITAAHASARFPFINPLAALPPEPGKPRTRGHLADGGYHDNSGSASLADLWRSLQGWLPPPWKARLILIRNGQPRIDCERAPRDGPPVPCLDPRVHPSDAELKADLLRPADRHRLDLLADLFGPLVALVNVSGIGAHGRQMPAALAAELAAQPDAPTPLFYDQLDNGDLVPLGWYLSPAARESIEGQAALYFKPGAPKP
ncbi:MAG TPA: hypothetical protein VFY73_15920 [Ideonella sp.]|uniref:hypothetical protein n=1 Tax=Ideonella sp. TaxID=1929293 RepID=UPI002E34C786|nr:hypothetical protein [Ideonella sp.]HEX5685508.1 hypothetical protein [Ideonella sp.]